MARLKISKGLIEATFLPPGVIIDSMSVVEMGPREHIECEIRGVPGGPGVPEGDVLVHVIVEQTKRIERA